MEHKVTGKTELVGLFAYPIRHSVSPAMQNEAFAYAGIDVVYVALEVGMGNTEEQWEQELSDAIKGMRAMHFVGANVSMPNKMRVDKYLDKLDRTSELTGAVNTIVNRDGVLTGYTTDGLGYLAALRDNGIDVTGKKITLVGCGGAGNSIQAACALNGVKEMSIFNLKDDFYEKEKKLLRRINEETDCHAELYDLADHDILRREIAASYLLANCTSMGMKPREGQTWLPDTSYLRPDLIVTDTIYSPHRTPFLKMAESVGCKVMNGDGMMLFQGAEAFRLWTGKEMPIEHMKEYLGITYD